ncbi:hypothetical protein COB21_03665 [Candidatus Aerophobetes bacterium]|uniref:Nucleotide-diphospho-sugar transferase domain-containing protein n=1 Tax=Aerophobetes bacterium TaxID=2030807 RepID=A0A2A4X352_UNCAE|nr:MAG: hypothetical protein COB21_03665 [Candidatus Aerophobetes bacterium]
MKNTKTLIVSFYTLGSPYEKEASFLKQSCEKLNLDFCIEPISCQGSWEKNCCFKPTFLKEKLLKYKQNILWIDCDAIVVKPLYIFNTIDEDIAAKYIHDAHASHPSKLMSGTLFLKYNPRILNLLDHWEKACAEQLKRDKKTWDQTVLRDVLAQDKHISLFSLPKAYCQVYDKIQNEEELQDSVIIHFQASRFTKKQESIAPLFKQLQHAHKKACVDAILNHFSSK